MNQQTPSLYEQIMFPGLMIFLVAVFVMTTITFFKYIQFKENDKELNLDVEDDKKPDKILEVLQKYLNYSIQRLYLQGTMALFITLIVGILMYTDIKLAMTWQLKMIDDAKNPTHVLAYLIFRSSALGVIATTILYFGARICISSFDQAVRFVKRKMGTVFLEYLYEYYKAKLKDQKVTLTQIMTFFEVWNKTVESAFSNIKTDKGDNLLIQNLKELSKEIEEEKSQNEQKDKES